MAGAPAVGAVERGWGGPNARSASRRSRVCVGIRCFPCRPRSMGDPVARGVQGQALSPVRLFSFGGLPGSATRCCRVCGCGGPVVSPSLACPVGAACRGGGGGPFPGGMACHRCEGLRVSGAVPPPAARSLGRAAGVQRPACPWCSWRGRGDPAGFHRVCPCGPALSRSRGSATRVPLVRLVRA